MIEILLAALACAVLVVAILLWRILDLVESLHIIVRAHIRNIHLKEWQDKEALRKAMDHANTLRSCVTGRGPLFEVRK